MPDRACRRDRDRNRNRNRNRNSLEVHRIACVIPPVFHYEIGE
jgi:hypothetical protein